MPDVPIEAQQSGREAIQPRGPSHVPIEPRVEAEKLRPAGLEPVQLEIEACERERLDEADTATSDDDGRVEPRVIQIAQHHGALGDNAHRIAKLEKGLQKAPRQPELPLHRLVAIGIPRK